LRSQQEKEDLTCLPTLQVADIPQKQENYDVDVIKGYFSRTMTRRSVLLLVVFDVTTVCETKPNHVTFQTANHSSSHVLNPPMESRILTPFYRWTIWM